MSDATTTPAPKAPTLVVAAVIVDGDRVLLTQRRGGTHLAGRWEFPGGKIEPGESPEEALAREITEEIGVRVRVGDALDVTFWRYPAKDVLLIFYRCDIVEGEVRDLEVAAHAWATGEELDGYEFPPADERVVAKLRALLRAR